MDNKIKDTGISCPECGASGSYTCTSCKHEIKFSLQWSREGREPEDRSREIKKEGLETDYISPDEFDAIEDLVDELSVAAPDDVKQGGNGKSEIQKRDLPKKPLKVKQGRESEEAPTLQGKDLIDDIKASLLEDIKNSVVKAVGTMKKDLLDELRSGKRPEAKTGESKKEEPKKVSSDSVESKTKEKPVKEAAEKVPDKDKQEKAKVPKKPDGITEELRKEELQKESRDTDEGDSWNKTIDVI